MNLILLRLGDFQHKDPSLYKREEKILKRRKPNITINKNKKERCPSGRREHIANVSTINRRARVRIPLSPFHFLIFFSAVQFFHNIIRGGFQPSLVFHY